MKDRNTAPAAAQEWTVKKMRPIDADKLREGFDEQIQFIIDHAPTIGSDDVNTAKSSHWFNASGWWLCYNCGGRNEGWKTTPFCPHCGCPMDELLDAEIE